MFRVWLYQDIYIFMCVDISGYLYVTGMGILGYLGSGYGYIRISKV